MNRFLLAFALTFGAAGIASAQSVSTVTQTGSANEAAVTQTASSTATVTQTESGLIRPPNPGNLVVLTQSASTATVTQEVGDGDPTGLSFSNATQMNQSQGGAATITQSGEYNWVTGDLNRIGTVRPLPGNDFVQSNSTLNVDQDGISNAVEGSQSASSARSTANVAQEGRFNTATLEQSGMGGNTATVVQTGDSSPPVSTGGTTIADRQRAEISQTGDGNHTASVTQTSGVSVPAAPNEGSNLADVNQDGLSQTATVRQTGYDNLATTNQLSGSLNAATVDQDGESNTATTNQSGSMNVAMADQRGANNVSTITQGADATPWNNNGTRNEARTLQIGTGTAANTATITQFGGNLKAAGSEAGTFLSTVLPASITTVINPYILPVAPGIVQVGEGNRTTLAQSGTWNGAAAVAVGSFNRTEVTQSGSSNFAGAAVLGNRNHVAITQSNRSTQDINNLAAVGVVGTGNEVTVEQTGTLSVAVFGAQGNGTTGTYDANGGLTNSDVSITQSGMGNQVVGYAIGDRNAITVLQSGTGNTAGTVNLAGMTIDAGIDVTGNLNTVGLTQSGTGNATSISITGNGNTSTTTQN